MDSIQAVVVGAGVVGLAAARALAQAGLEVIVIESENAIGTQTSSRNSEVIHAGIYYQPDSLKAAYCVPGRDMLYDYCRQLAVPHQRCGKLIVAAGDEQLSRLKQLQLLAPKNGVNDLQWLDKAAVRALEPAVDCDAALLSPSTGIIDSHQLMLALQSDAERANATIAFGSRLQALRRDEQGLVLDVAVGESTEKLRTTLLINAAGHGAPQIAALDDQLLFKVESSRLAKGNYFRLQGRTPFSRLIYPMPGPHNLGVHVSLDLAGRAKFGPDVEWVETWNYEVDPSRQARFEQAIRQYWPGLPENSLSPDYAGIRPQILVNGEHQRDFVVAATGEAGSSRVVHLLGFESPALTACLAIGGHCLELASGATTRAISD